MQFETREFEVMLHTYVTLNQKKVTHMGELQDKKVSDSRPATVTAVCGTGRKYTQREHKTNKGQHRRTQVQANLASDMIYAEETVRVWYKSAQITKYIMELNGR
jgi:hypothetical protein